MQLFFPLSISIYKVLCNCIVKSKCNCFRSNAWFKTGECIRLSTLMCCNITIFTNSARMLQLGLLDLKGNTKLPNVLK